MFRDFLQSRNGSTAIEYTLIASVIVLAIVIAITEVGRQVAGFYEDTAAAFTDAD